MFSTLMTQDNFTPTLIIGVLLLGAIYFLCIGLFFGKDKEFEHLVFTSPSRTDSDVSWLALQLYLFLFAVFLLVFLHATPVSYSAYGVFVITPLYTSLFLFCIFLSLIWLATFSNRKVYPGIDDGILYFLIIIIITAIYILLIANDIVIIYISLELQSLCLYILVASGKQYSKHAAESSVKYFLIGSYASALILGGLVLLFCVTGLTSLMDMRTLMLCLSPDSAYLFAFNLGCLLIGVGVATKLGVAPFHMWLPDVYEGASTDVVAFLSTISKLGLFLFLFKLQHVASFCIVSPWPDFPHFLLYAGILSVALANIAILRQFSWKRLIAYSGIANTGFILIAFSLGTLSGDAAGFFYICLYLITTMTWFVYFSALTSFSDFKEAMNLETLRSLPTAHPFLAALFVLLLFNLAGIPPLQGFYIKYTLLQSILQDGNLLGGSVLILLTALGTLYPLILVVMAFFSKKNYFIFLMPIRYTKAWLIIVLTALVPLLGFYNQEILIFIEAILQDWPF